MVALFSYKPGKSFLHKTSAWAKLLFIPVINILFLLLPPYFACGLVVAQFVLACSLRFSFKEQYSDLRPVIYYAVLLYGFKLILWAMSLAGVGAGAAGVVGAGVGVGSAGSAAGVAGAGAGVASATGVAGTAGVAGQAAGAIFDLETFFLLVKLFCVMQSASLVFKTSTLLQLREGIGSIEETIRKIFHLKQRNTFTNILSMFLNFVPMLAQIWEQSKKAWKARGGKTGIKMYAVLLPVLFSIGMKKAYNQARAIAIRDKKVM